MSYNLKRQETLKEKLKIDFSPKLVASNPAFQPIYDVIFSMLKSTEFWEDLERAIDATIAEIEQKVVGYVLGMNPRAMDLRVETVAAPPKNINQTPRAELTRLASLKADNDSRSVYSNIDKKLTEAKRKLAVTYQKSKEIPKQSYVPKPKQAPSSLIKPKKEGVPEARMTAPDISMNSHASLASDLLLSDEFQAKMAKFLQQQIQQDPSLLYRQIGIPASFEKQGTGAIPVLDLFKKGQPSDSHRSGRRNPQKNAETSSDHSGLKEDQFNEFPAQTSGQSSNDKRGSNTSAIEGPIVETQVREQVGPSNRYQKKGRSIQPEEIPGPPNAENMFKAPISEEERPVSVSVSDNPSVESYNSDAHERRLEMLKKNIVRRESLSKSAGLAFSFGKVPARMVPLAENLTYAQQISNFE